MTCQVFMESSQLFSQQLWIMSGSAAALLFILENLSENTCYCDVYSVLFWDVTMFLSQVSQPLSTGVMWYYFLPYALLIVCSLAPERVGLFSSWVYSLDSSVVNNLFILLASTSLVYLFRMVARAVSLCGFLQRGEKGWLMFNLWPSILRITSTAALISSLVSMMITEIIVWRTLSEDSRHPC